jgi:ferritin-like protein
MSEYHEPTAELSAEARDYHRALKSLLEEIEAIDWYHQRVDVCKDDELRGVLAHNRDEEIEHACMALEWLRRNMPMWNEHLRTYLFTEESITEIEEKDGESTSTTAGPDLGIRSLKTGD